MATLEGLWKKQREYTIKCKLVDSFILHQKLQKNHVSTPIRHKTHMIVYPSARNETLSFLPRLQNPNFTNEAHVSMSISWRKNKRNKIYFRKTY